MEHGGEIRSIRAMRLDPVARKMVNEKSEKGTYFWSEVMHGGVGLEETCELFGDRKRRGREKRVTVNSCHIKILKIQVSRYEAL